MGPSSQRPAASWLADKTSGYEAVQQVSLQIFRRNGNRSTTVAFISINERRCHGVYILQLVIRQQLLMVLCDVVSVSASTG